MGKGEGHGLVDVGRAHGPKMMRFVPGTEPGRDAADTIDKVAGKWRHYSHAPIALENIGRWDRG